MYRITAICDKCKKEETRDGRYFSESEKGWKEVKFEIGQYDKNTYLFCPECCEALGLYTPNNDSTPHIETVADRLFEFITEIVQEAKE